jgi:hypothetical protein
MVAIARSFGAARMAARAVKPASRFVSTQGTPDSDSISN